MSKTQNAQDIASEFWNKHPSSAGWRVHRLQWDAEEPGPRVLPAFLREKHPAALLRQRTYTSVSWKDGRTAGRGLTDSSKKSSRLSEDSWCGQIELVWDGKPIHFERATLFDRFHGERHWSFVATKDPEVLENLLGELREFARSFEADHSSIFIISEGHIPKPALTWDDLILPELMKQDIRRNVETFLKAEEQYRRLGLPYRRGLLFVGSPGNGKTLATKVIAANVEACVISLPLMNTTHDAEIRGAFLRAAREAPSVLILEDIDKFAKGWGITLPHILNLLDGLDAPEGILVLATSNEPERLDKALLQRPSRFDQLFAFNLPGFAERLRLLRLRGMEKFSESALQTAAEASRGFTMAYVQEIVVSAFLTALDEGREAKDSDLLDSAVHLRIQQRLRQRAAHGGNPEGRIGFDLGTPKGPTMEA